MTYITTYMWTLPPADKIYILMHLLVQPKVLLNLTFQNQNTWILKLQVNTRYYLSVSFLCKLHLAVILPVINYHWMKQWLLANESSGYRACQYLHKQIFYLYHNLFFSKPLFTGNDMLIIVKMQNNNYTI